VFVKIICSYLITLLGGRQLMEIPTRLQALRHEVSRLRNEVVELRACNAALEKENTLLSLMGPEAIARLQGQTGAFRRVGA
jgi:hypothetical protein